MSEPSSAHSEDRRAARTRTALWNALIALVQEVGWDQTTIRLLCKRAKVARSSFYLHFSNMQDLLDHGFRRMLEEAARLNADTAGVDRLSTLDWLVDHVSESPQFFTSFGAAKENAFLFSRFEAAVSEGLKRECGARGLPANNDRLAFISGGAMGLTRRWLASGFAMERYEIKALMQDLARRCLA